MFKECKKVNVAGKLVCEEENGDRWGGKGTDERGFESQVNEFGIYSEAD